MHEEINAKEGTVTITCNNCKTKLLIYFYNDRRQFFRKDVNIAGVVTGKTSHVNMTIRDLSCQGAQFVVNQQDGCFHKDDRILMRFASTNEEAAKIELGAIIRNVNLDGSYSAEFINMDEHSTRTKMLELWLK